MTFVTAGGGSTHCEEHGKTLRMPGHKFTVMLLCWSSCYAQTLLLLNSRRPSLGASLSRQVCEHPTILYCHKKMTDISRISVDVTKTDK